jgi:hypothetical protein
MPETPEAGTSLTNKCSDTTEESIQNTSGATPKQSRKRGKRTRSKQHESDTNVSSVQHEPLPRYLPSELSRLTFNVGESRYRADDTEHTFLWMKFVADYADVTGAVDWDDLEERAHFLNMLYEFCEREGMPFPLEDSPPEKLIENI